MDLQEFTELKLFITGPTYIRPEVRRAGALPEFGHRDAENVKRFQPIHEGLRALARIDDSYDVLIFNGSGSTAMEASIRSLVADDETVLNVSVGAFGDLYHKMAVANGKKAVQLRFDWGEAIDLDRLREALEQHRPAVATFTQNETSTGVTNDIEAVCALIREYGAMPLVDGVSIFGGADVRIPESGCAYYSTSTQKSLGLPAGFGLAFVRPEAFEKAAKVANRGHSTDILTQQGRARKFQTVTTPNTTLANQFAVQMAYIVNEEGVENRFKRHEALRDRVHAWVEDQDGFELFAPEGYRSPTLTAVKAPKGITADDLKKRLKESLRGRGYLYDPGYAKANDAFKETGRPAVFRIGHMGDVTMDMMEAYLETLSEELKKL
ncbi:MAG: alanine--glyoxylate aminotransferase family protein [Desulfovibrionaceae bacterium]